MPPVRFADGESIRTEISCKYDRDGLESMLERAGYRLTHWYERHEDGYALVLAVPVT
jgi:L-histidine N-alpha-methyltransferase